MIIWKLQMGYNFTDFHFTLDSEKAFFLDFVDNYYDVSKSAEEIWKPLLMIKGEPKKATDFFDVINSGVLAMGPSAFNFFDQGVGSNIELLPIDTDAGLFNVVNIVGYIDCLDREISICNFSKNGLITNYRYLHFDEEKLKDIYFFKIPELPYSVFVTNNLQGICFRWSIRGLKFEPDNCIYENV